MPSSSTDKADTPRADPLGIILDRIPQIIIGVLLLVAIAINFADVISRYFFLYAFPWGEEILTFIIIWAVFIGAISVAYNNSHLSVDILPRALPPTLAYALHATIWLTFIAMTSYIAWQSFQVVSVFHRNQGVSLVLNLPMWIPHAALLAGFTLMAVAAALRLRAYVIDPVQSHRDTPSDEDK